MNQQPKGRKGKPYSGAKKSDAKKYSSKGKASAKRPGKYSGYKAPNDTGKGRSRNKV